MTELEKTLVADAVDQLENTFSNAGCNDLDIPNTPEAIGLWNEYQAYNLGIPLTKLKSHPDYDELSPERNGKLCVNDSLQIYLLKKHLGLLDKRRPLML